MLYFEAPKAPICKFSYVSETSSETFHPSKTRSAFLEVAFSGGPKEDQNFVSQKKGALCAEAS